MYLRKLLFILTFVLTGLMISCSDTSTGSEPEPRITTGTLEVTASTTGEGTDEDGYTVTFSDKSESIAPNGTVKFQNIKEGAYNIELNELAMGCAVEGDNPVSVDIVAEETTSVTFGVTCEVSTAEGTIAFSQTVDQQFEIFTMKADGSNIQKLTNNTVQDQNPAISPDGQRIAFVRQDLESSTLDNDIWVMDIDGSNQQILTDNPVDDKRPVWSPDGKKIAFESGKESYSIYVMNADGSNSTKLTDDKGQDHSATWSADNGIAFISDRQNDDSSDIYRINWDGSDLKILISAQDENGINLFYPAWSPDGSQIAYQGFSSNGAPQVFLANADGSNAQMISSQEYSSARQPSWSPDGTYITFLELASSQNSDAIWIVKIDGLNPIRLTDDQTTRLAFPDWGI